MAWHEGKPEYRSSPNSKEVRENFAYLKAIADILSGAGVTQADLVALRGASSAPGANKIAKFNSDGIMKGAELNMTGWTSAQSNTSSTSLNIGTVTVGDVLHYEGRVSIDNGPANGHAFFYLGYDNVAGTAKLLFMNAMVNLAVRHALTPEGYGSFHISATALVETGGTLVLKTTAVADGTPTYTSNRILAYFLKKQ
jgi:hypothetical protein